MKEPLCLFLVVLEMSFLLSSSIVWAGDVVDNTGKTTFYAVILGLEDGFDNAQKVKGALEYWKNSWQANNINLLPKGAAIRKNIEDAINAFKQKAKAGDEFLFYYVGHGSDGYINSGKNCTLETQPAEGSDDEVRAIWVYEGDKRVRKAYIWPGPNGKLETKPSGDDEIVGRKDGEKDPQEAQADPKDEPDEFDNRIKIDGGEITDDELSLMLSGFQNCVSIVIVLDACYTSTFASGNSDPITPDSTAITQKKGDKNVKACDVEMIGAEGLTPTFPDSKTITDGFLEALQDNGKGITKADEKGPDPEKEGEKGEKDGSTTLDEIIKFITTITTWYHLYSVSFDNDSDGKLEEDYCDYYPFSNGTMYYAREDNDGDGLIDEDPDLIKFVFHEYKTGFGGIVLSVDKFGLLAPYIGLASTIVVATVATAIYVKRRKEKQ